MGIVVQSLKAMLHENRYRPIAGNVLLIGKSTVHVRWPHLKALASAFDIEVDERDFHLRDVVTKRSSNDYWLDDVELIRVLFPGVEAVDVLDVSPYEGANVIADMNVPVPLNLHHRYDFIYDSSVLDNVFNPAQMIQNVAAMLAAGGRVCLINVASFFPGAYCSCHPEWFYSFFAANDFLDVKVYLTVQRGMLDEGEALTDLWRYVPTFTPAETYNYLAAVKAVDGIANTIVVAELGERLFENVRYPVNLQYIASSGAFDWASREVDFAGSKRPIMMAEFGEAPAHPHLTDHYSFLGLNF